MSLTEELVGVDNICPVCYHNKVCKRVHDGQLNTNCPYFQDKASILTVPCEVGTAINKLFSQDEIIALWCVNSINKQQSYLLWHGVAKTIPEKYAKRQLLFFKGVLPESRFDAVTLNLQVASDTTCEENFEIFGNN